MNDILLFGIFFSLFPIGFVCMAASYFLHIRHVWHRPDRKARIKLILTSGKRQEWQREPRAARTFHIAPPLGVAYLAKLFPAS